MKKQTAAYAFKWSSQQTRALAIKHGYDVHEDKVFKDAPTTKKAMLSELLKMLGTCDGVFEVTVIVHQLSEFGTGAKANQVVKDIERMGHKVFVPKAEKNTPGRKPVDWVDHKDSGIPEDGYKAMWHDVALTHSDVLRIIKTQTGQTFTRQQLIGRWGNMKKKK